MFKTVNLYGSKPSKWLLPSIILVWIVCFSCLVRQTMSFMFRTPTTVTFLKDVEFQSSALVDNIDLSAEAINNIDWSELNHCLVPSGEAYVETNEYDSSPYPEVHQVIRYKYELYLVMGAGALAKYDIYEKKPKPIIGTYLGSWYLYPPESDDLLIIPIGVIQPHVDRYKTVHLNPIGRFWKQKVEDRDFYFTNITSSVCLHNFCFIIGIIDITGSQNALYRFDIVLHSWKKLLDLPPTCKHVFYSYELGQLILVEYNLLPSVDSLKIYQVDPVTLDKSESSRTFSSQPPGDFKFIGFVLGDKLGIISDHKLDLFNLRDSSSSDVIELENTGTVNWAIPLTNAMVLYSAKNDPNENKGGIYVQCI